jgi:hypothetical protein
VESEGILERNVAGIRPFRYYKADVDVVLSGPHGKLLVHVPGGLYFMLPVDRADTPALREVLHTEPEPDLAGTVDEVRERRDDDVPHAQQPVDSLVGAFLTRIKSDADSRPPGAGVQPGPSVGSVPADESGTPEHRSDGAETIEASAERFLVLIDGDQPTADTDSRTDEQ